VEQPSALETALARLADSSQPTPETVSVTVLFSCPVSDLEAAGFVAWTVIPSPDDRPSVAAGPIPTSRLRELAAVPGVRYVEGSQPHQPELNISVPEIGADTLHDRSPGRKGAGVVVAVIDSGIDIDHKSFRRDDGTTRIVGIWDQTLTATGPLEAPPAMFVRPPPAPPPPGVEYTQADIVATLANRENGTPFPPPTAAPRSPIAVRTVDTDGHGTHVAGIAAGDGSQSGNCRGSGVYVGVAPAADILVVKRSTDNPRIGESTNLLNALDWIWSHPAVAGNPTATPPVPPRPVVVNMSFGDNCGPHDGTSPVESALDLFLLTHPGHAAVKSAGNEGATDRHARFGVPPNGSADVTFRVNPAGFADCRLELWYQQNAILNTTLRGPVPPGGGGRPTIATVGSNDLAAPVADPTTPAARQTTVTITTRSEDPRNGNGLIEMDFSSPGGVPLFAGEYEIHLENPLNSFVVVDGYTDKNTPGLVFTSHVDRDNTITTPGNGKLVVTVGAYAPRRGVLFFKWNGDLADFSSFGPTRDVRAKPDIAAPGAKITSVKSGEAGLKHCCCDCCVWSYTDETKEGGEFSGTSMAAPHATGVIALMLEKDATLNAGDILKILADTASEPEVGHGSLPDSKWGAGRLNALGAVDGVPGPSPIPGPTPLLGPTPPGTPPVPAPVSGPTALLRPSDDGEPPGARLLQTPAGQHWYALVSRHFSEVRGLISSNKRVAVHWHRMEGPSLLRLLGPALAGVGVLSIADDPESLLAWRPRVARFLDALEQFGSPGLVADTRSHRDLLLSLELDDIAAMIAAPGAGHAA
jgi:subtilisin family serine protease